MLILSLMSLTSACRSVLVERQMPYRVTQTWDQACRHLGHPEKVLTAEGFTVRVRRLTSDVDFVQNVLRDREYLIPGLTIRPTDTVVDVGGNIGLFTLQAARLAARAITVEPEAENLRLLRWNLAHNAITNVTVVPMAVADRPGTIAFYVSREGGYHTILDGQLIGGRGRETRVPCLTLAELFEAHQIEQCALLKLDCEGAEYTILPSLTSETLGRISQIAMEYHRGGDIAPILTRLTAAGFSVLRHQPFSQHGGHLFLTR